MPRATAPKRRCWRKRVLPPTPRLSKRRAVFAIRFSVQGKCDYEKMIADLGQVHFLESPGLGLKWHPCSAPQFLAADAALHLKREHKIDYADVAKMEVSIPPLRYARHYAPEVKTGLRGKFAINYVVAMCISGRQARAGNFHRRARQSTASPRSFQQSSGDHR